ncbi:MAG: hypothetical protein HZB53_22050 [Chloroflexi bacterium]|nr:hypothetical protein [Chloroflexota bacterium]
MSREGPPLETLLRRLAETPADFLAEPRIGAAGSVNVAAVVSDTLRDLGLPPADAQTLAVFQPASAREHRNRLSIVLIICWLLHDPAFAERPDASRTVELLSDGAQALAPYVQAPKLVSDPDRREELARTALDRLGLRPAGESEAQAQDRLTTVSSAGRSKVISAARAAEERARQIREALARKAAEEAADKATRE